MNPAEVLGALTWRDALDLGLLFFFCYGLLRLLQGTRAVPVLLAVAFFAALAVVARTLELVAVAALLQYFLEYVFIILVVVFNQEIRRVLVRVGQRLLPQTRRKAAVNAVERLLVAADRLRKARIGALIIMEGEIDVLEVCSDGGVEIDAPMVSETLVALAVPESVNVAHDGGILIQSFRISRAGLICPLSQREDMDPRFGTRHRGAIGVSEETDALVLVLSEERGEMRVVEDGEISEPLDRDGLRSRILEWVEGEQVPPEPDDTAEPDPPGPSASSSSNRLAPTPGSGSGSGSEGRTGT